TQRQTQHGMHLPELAEKKRQHHDAGDDSELRGLEVYRTEMEPAARAIYFLADEFRQDQKSEAGEVHWQRAPADPAVIDQTGDDKSEKSDHDPVGLFAPEF